MVVCFGFVCLSFLAIVVLGLLPKIQAAENILPNPQVLAAATKVQPQVVASYGKLPLSFEANQGQVSGSAQFLSRGLGYTLFLTGDEAVLCLGKAARAGLMPDATTLADKPTNGDGPGATESVLRMKLIGASASAGVAGAEELPGKSNYIIGNDPTKWRTNVPNYAKVRYQNVYPGVDLVYYGTQGGQLEYDFVVAPGADAHSIGLSFQGAGKIRVDKRTGDLVLALAGSELRFRKPVVYQPASGSGLLAERRPIDGRFVLTGRNQIGFQVAAYDHRAPLIIDPVLLYSTYLGGAKYNLGYRVAVDASGSAYVAGATNSTVFPTTAGVFKSLLNPGGCAIRVTKGQPKEIFTCPDAFVTKLDPTGTQMIYSTYLGGSASDGATGISVDSSGYAYVTGATGSTDFPTTAGAFQTSATDSSARTHAFATKLNPTGSALIYSTYLAGTHDDVSTISALDSSGYLYVAGGTNSKDFPTTPGAFQRTISGTSCHNYEQTWPCFDGFIAKLNQQGTALVYSTYLGGNNHDSVLGLAVDSTGSAYLTGGTASTNFPLANALQSSFGTPPCSGTTLGGNPRPCFFHAFVTKLNSTGTALDYSTYLGGNGYDAGLGIAVDATGAAYVTGATNSTNFPTTAGAAQTIFGGGTCNFGVSLSFNCSDAFVAKLEPSGTSLDYSTYLGGSSFDLGWAIAVDNAGIAYVVGGTNSLDFPTDATTGNFQGGTCSTDIAMFILSTHQAGSNFNCPNAFLTEVDPTGSTRLFSTYLGGASGDLAFSVAVDATGGVYMAGSTLSPNFPTSAGALQTSLTGHADAFISKFGSLPSGSLSVLNLTFVAVSGTTSASQPVTLTNTGTNSLTISSVVASANFAETDNCVGSVAGGGSCTINVTFSPTATGPFTGTLTITDNNNGVAASTQTVNLSGSGTAPAPVAVVSPSGLTFTSQNVGTTSGSQPVTLSNNTGSGSLTIASIAASANFGETNNCSGSVVVGGSCSINVTFSPTAAGSLTGTLTITDNNNGVTGSTQTVGLTGTGTAPVASVSSPLTFSGQALGTTSASQAVTLSNTTGTAALTIASIATTGTNAGDFAVASTGTTCSTSSPVAAGGSCTIYVTFTPTATGSRNGTLTITDNSNGVAGSMQTVALSGTGTGPVVSLSSPLTFSAQLVGSASAAQTVTLTNTGNANLTFTAIAATAPFAIASSGTTCTTSTPVAAAGTCTVAVTFTPTAAGAASASLSFSDNAPSSPQTLTLSGTGQDFSVAPPSGSSTSTTVAPGLPATYTLSVGGEGGLSGTVTFTCTGAPSEATCTVSPNPATAGSTATNVTVTVTTTAPSVSAPRSRPLPPVLPLSPGMRGLLMLALVLIVMAWPIMRRNQAGVSRWRLTMIPLGLGLLLTLALAGCGGGGGGSVTHNPGTPAGTYPLTVTGTTGSGSSALSHSVTLTLTVS
jgi:hypothetical protein